MTDEHRMEQLARAYVHAVAAGCGCTCARPDPDYGVDLSLRQVALLGNEFKPIGPTLDVQLKSTRTATIEVDHVVYDLERRAYDLLRQATRMTPHYLVLVVLPANFSEWIGHSEQQLELRGCAYWMTLRREPPVPNKSTVRIRIRIPRANQFTPANLERIMDAIRRQEDV
ncbi:MAG: DUF4365 domain-containing protein [Gemmataceae bacterium]